MKTLTCLTFAFLACQLSAADYVVVVSRKTASHPQWAKVVAILEEKHEAIVETWTGQPDEVLPSMQRTMPRYTCFVARPEEAGKAFVKDVHRITRAYDDDPYIDTFWGILTGHDARNAADIAARRKPLVVNKTASGTEISLAHCAQAKWFSELEPAYYVDKTAGESRELNLPTADSTAALAATLNEWQADLFITSGHATERDWQIGFSYRNGSFRSSNGELYGLTLGNEKIAIKSDNTKIYLPIGNCLMGHIDGPDAMALAWMKSAGVTQMLGYVEPTWYGYMGWGVLDYFLEQPGRYTLTEAFFANHHALIHRLSKAFPGTGHKTDAGRLRQVSISPQGRKWELGGMDAKGLLFDRDVVAFYGDPAWQSRMADRPRRFDQEMTNENGNYSFTVSPAIGKESYAPANVNGSQRGYRPFVFFLPERIDPEQVRILEGKDLNPVIADDFVLIPHPGQGDAEPLRLRFELR